MKEPTIPSLLQHLRPFKSHKPLTLIGMAASLAGVGLLTGCIFSPERGKTPPPPPTLTYLVPSTPQAVFNNLIKSYSERDSTHYKDCFAPSYVGQSYDGYDASGYQPYTYSFDDEAMHISALQRSTTIFHATLDLPSYTTAPVDTLAGDPPGWVSINIYNPVVQIDDSAGSTAIAARENFLYKFEPTAVSTTVSPTGKLWKIVRWAEIAPAPL